MKHAFLALLAVLVPLQVMALETDELLALVAMPVAVAAVGDVTGVPVGELSHFVATLNRAQVPPTQVVQVVRYAPAALVVQDVQPTFVQYVDQQYDSGITGSRLVTVIEDRYRTTYDLEPQYLTYDAPVTTYVVRDDYVPSTVITRVAQYAPAYTPYGTTYRSDLDDDLLGLVAMPLAVAAVSEMAGVPLNDVARLVASLNAAQMPPVQVVEVLRYAPAAIVVDNVYYDQPRFVPWVGTQVASGIRGPGLFDVIGQRLRTYDLAPRYEPIRSPDVVFVRDEYFPPVVRTRIAETRSHPHGGPPGQLKKQLGLQTGAEVVHGSRPGWDIGERRAVASARVDRAPERTVARERERKAPARARAERSERKPAVARESSRPGNPAVKKSDKPKRAERSVERPRAAERPQRVERPRGNSAAAKSNADRGRGSAKASGNKAGGQGNEKGKGKG